MVESIDSRVEEGKNDSSLAVDTTKPAAKPVIFHPKNWPKLMAFVNGASAGFAFRGPKFLIFKLLNIADPEMATDFGKSWFLNGDRRDILKRMPNAILQESLYGATLFGPYEILSRKLEYANNGVRLSPYQGFGCAVVSGAVGAYLFTPIVLANDRLKAPNATHSRLLHDVYHKAANEGILSLWKSGSPVAKRICSANVGILASYKPSLDYLRDPVGLGKTPSVLGAGVVSGLFASACSYPCVYVQTTLTHMKPGTDGKYPFNGYMDCALKIMKFGGPFAIYRGSTMYFLRLTPGITCLWFFFEEMKMIDKSS